MTFVLCAGKTFSLILWYNLSVFKKKVLRKMLQLKYKK